MDNRLNMTQKELILEYIDKHGSILPAKISGQVFRGVMFGSETSKRCRELRALEVGEKNRLVSHQEGKFEVFTRPDKAPKQGTDMERLKELFKEVRKADLEAERIFSPVTPSNQLFQLEIREQ